MCLRVARATVSFAVAPPVFQWPQQTCLRSLTVASSPSPFSLSLTAFLSSFSPWGAPLSCVRPCPLRVHLRHHQRRQAHRGEAVHSLSFSPHAFTITCNAVVLLRRLRARAGHTEGLRPSHESGAGELPRAGLLPCRWRGAISAWIVHYSGGQHVRAPFHGCVPVRCPR